MKLIFCPKCLDVVKLQRNMTYCVCKCSWGYYEEDGLNAVINTVAIPLGFANPALVAALKKQPDKGWGETFTAFVIPKECPTITVLEEVID